MGTRCARFSSQVKFMACNVWPNCYSAFPVWGRGSGNYMQPSDTCCLRAVWRLEASRSVTLSPPPRRSRTWRKRSLVRRREEKSLSMKALVANCLRWSMNHQSMTHTHPLLQTRCRIVLSSVPSLNPFHHGWPYQKKELPTTLHLGFSRCASSSSTTVPIYKWNLNNAARFENIYLTVSLEFQFVKLFFRLFLLTAMLFISPSYIFLISVFYFFLELFSLSFSWKPFFLPLYCYWHQDVHVVPPLQEQCKMCWLEKC